MAIRDLFEEFTSVLRALEPPCDPVFRPPASEVEISAAESELGLHFPDDLKELLRCANGQDLRGWTTSPVIPRLRLQPGTIGTTSHTWLGGLDAIVENTRAQRLMLPGLKDDEPFEVFGPVRFHENLIEFTVTENADSCVIDLQPERGGRPGQIVMLCTQPNQVVVVADSLHSFLKRVVDSYQSGLCTLIHNEPYYIWGEP